MRSLLTYLLFLIGSYVSGQHTDKWAAYWDEDSELMGFKNSAGEIEIEPKFMGLTIARTFESIIAVMENKGEGFESYYLTKSGKKVGFDSLYFFDNGADCESEGYIRFKNKTDDKVGMFNSKGEVVIPAIYDALSRVRNGLIWALKGAKKEYWDEHNETGCNHYSWAGGKDLLLDISNQVLVDDFSHKGRLDFYSLQVEKGIAADDTKTSFKGTQDQYYTFTDVEKDFKDWLHNQLVPSLTLENLEAASKDTIVYYIDSLGWVKRRKADFFKDNFSLVRDRLLAVNTENFFVSHGGLNPYIYEEQQYNKYFNNCGEAREGKHPTMAVIIDGKKAGDLVQDHFVFLKTDLGYKLIEVTIGNGDLK